MPIVRRFGWKPDVPDARDFRYKAPVKFKTVRPPVVDLRPLMPPVFNQGALGSCTAQSAAAAAHYLWDKQKENRPLASRLFIYYNTRMMENAVNEDAGATIRGTVQSLNVYGAASEDIWKYVEGNVFIKPPPNAYTDGALNQALRYSRVNQNEIEVESRLAEGFPVLIGFMVYSSMMTDKVAKSGIVPMPNLQRDSANGGHAVCIVGYSHPSRQFIVRNSWGEE